MNLPPVSPLFRHGLVVVVLTLGGLCLPAAEPAPGSLPGAQVEGAKRQELLGVSVDPARIVKQKDVSDVACGPAAVLHALRFGTKGMQAAGHALDGADGPGKLQLLIENHAKKPSRDYKSGDRWRKDGMSCADLTDLYNDVLTSQKLPKVAGFYLNREKDEAPPAFLRRVHGRLVHSLSQQIPVVISVRSFAPIRDDKNKDGFHWEGLGAHFVLLTRVPARLQEADRGFAFEFVDSDSGKVESGYVHVETTRNFTAARGNAEKWEWLTDYPFLLVTAPSLPLRTGEQAWWSRTIVTLNFGIFAAVPSR
jgi:hypothetical protein